MKPHSYSWSLGLILGLILSLTSLPSVSQGASIKTIEIGALNLLFSRAKKTTFTRKEYVNHYLFNTGGKGHWLKLRSGNWHHMKPGKTQKALDGGVFPEGMVLKGYAIGSNPWQIFETTRAYQRLNMLKIGIKNDRFYALGSKGWFEWKVTEAKHKNWRHGVEMPEHKSVEAPDLFNGTALDTITISSRSESWSSIVLTSTPNDLTNFY